MYKLKKQLDNEIVIIINTDNNTSFLPDLTNSDFIEYQKWLSLGNQPLPPDAE